MWRNNNKSNNLNYNNANNLDFNFNNFPNINNINFNSNQNSNNLYNQILQKNIQATKEANWNLINPLSTKPNEHLNSEFPEQLKPKDNLENLTFNQPNNDNKNSKTIYEKENERGGNKVSKKINSEENLISAIADNSNKNSDNKMNEFKSELNNSLEIDTDIGSNTIKVDTIENQEASPIGDNSKEDEKGNNTANTQESSSSKILIKDLINYNVK